MINHISYDSPWLWQHLDISYHNQNTPQLIPAIELDGILHRISNHLSDNHRSITTEEDLSEIIEQIRLELARARFEEYWLINEQQLIHDLSPSFSITQVMIDHHVHIVAYSDLYSAIRESLVESRIGHRFPLSVNLSQISSLLKSHTLLVSTLHQAVMEINQEIRDSIIRPTITSILDNLRNTIRYRFISSKSSSSSSSSSSLSLHPQGPTFTYPLVEPYFTCIQPHPEEMEGDREDDLLYHYELLVSMEEGDSSIHHFSSSSSSSSSPPLQSSLFCANNGWTWNNHPDPLHIHRLQQQIQSHPIQSNLFTRGFIINTPYLLREVVIWSDCVKLRYYHHPPAELLSSTSYDVLDPPCCDDWNDNNNDDDRHHSHKMNEMTKLFSSQDITHPNGTWILPVMKTYIQLAAFLFDGFRLDNCHNTPIPLLEDLIPSARLVRPSLFILAELFTSNQHTDVEYVRRVGIDMIVREVCTIPSYACSLSNSPNDHDNDNDNIGRTSNQYIANPMELQQQGKTFGDLLYAAGGDDLGTLQAISEIPRYITNTRLPVVLFDLTHDNSSYLQRYQLETIPSVTVLAGMAVAHVASTRGHDIAYPQNPSVIEQRLYKEFSQQEWRSMTNDELITMRMKLLTSSSSSQVKLPGNIQLRLLMNTLHQLLSQQSFTERYIHFYENANSISIERRQTGSNYSVFAITRLAFSKPSTNPSFEVTVLGRVEGMIASVFVPSQTISNHSILQAMTNETYLCGVPMQVEVQTDCFHPFFTHTPQGENTLLQFSSQFTPGSSIILLLYAGHQPTPSHLLNCQECISIDEILIYRL